MDVHVAFVNDFDPQRPQAQDLGRWVVQDESGEVLSTHLSEQEAQDACEDMIVQVGQ
jgi:hypothetical protein